MDFLLTSRTDQRTRTAARLLLATLIATASPAAVAHDGGVIDLLVFTAVVGLILGAIGGALSGWLGRRLMMYLGSSLLACGGAVLIIELTTDGAIAQNFWPNIGVLVPVAFVPLASGYWVAHLIAARSRKKRAAMGLRESIHED